MLEKPAKAFPLRPIGGRHRRVKRNRFAPKRDFREYRSSRNETQAMPGATRVPAFSAGHGRATRAGATTLCNLQNCTFSSLQMYFIQEQVFHMDMKSVPVLSRSKIRIQIRSYKFTTCLDATGCCEHSHHIFSIFFMFKNLC